MKILKINKLSKSWDGIKAVDDFSMEVNKGELLSILGPSGCGKSTLLACIGGIEEVEKGRIELDGNCVFDAGAGIFTPPEKRGIGFVFQNYALWPHMSVERNISYPLRVRGVSKSSIRNEVEHMLNLLKLEEKKNKHPGQLSGGEQQRVALGRALIMKPRLLLLDEPLSNLDAKLREQMQIEIRNIQQKLGVTTIHVTHDQSEAMAMSDRMAVMNKGKLIQIGKPLEVYNRPGTVFTADFMGQNNIIGGRIDRSRGQVVFISNSAESVVIAVDGRTADSSSDVVCAVRPEDIKISRNSHQGTGGSGCSGWLGAVLTEKIYRGAHFMYTAEIEGLKLKILAHSSERFELHKKVYLRIEKAVYLPQATTLI